MTVNYIHYFCRLRKSVKESLWNIIVSYGIPNKIIKMIQILYEDSECAVLDDGVESKWFRLKQG